MTNFLFLCSITARTIWSRFMVARSICARRDRLCSQNSTSEKLGRFGNAQSSHHRVQHRDPWPCRRHAVRLRLKEMPSEPLPGGQWLRWPGLRMRSGVHTEEDAQEPRPAKPRAPKAVQDLRLGDVG